MQTRLFISAAKNLSCVLFVGLLLGCSGDKMPKLEGDRIEYTFNGLSGHVVTHLYQHNDQLFAATDQGLYIKTPTSHWSATGLMDKKVLAIAILSVDHLIASVRETDDEGIFSDQLIESTDGGETWHSIEHNFGAEDPETLYGLYYDETNNALYATGVEALAVSLDEGRNWELLNGFWDGFGQPKSVVKHNPATNDIWYGGQNGMEQLVLERYSLDTQEAQSFRDLMPSPSVVYGIVFDPENEAGVYVSGEGGIVKTENNGEDWSTLIGDVDYRFYFGLALDPHDPQTIYTGGWTKQEDAPQPLIFEVSTDGGATWTKHQHSSTTLRGGVRSILATTENDATVIYLGLYGGGIMKLTVVKE
ncbi:hypothetical protein [Marinimicrobium sp. ABcell2]|uniref:sialidase family protein n=1 Tax=Marinimicrobium sp. ABcell2 TaxID=3069751 RepID=UPI0027AE6367|nr:hypothetical protein [Marinimicrobium sp. ABcell2]MDQ2075134.1 hypothetical protein [Marinimicrobium sp. ABcell2]